MCFISYWISISYCLSLSIITFFLYSLSCLFISVSLWKPHIFLSSDSLLWATFAMTVPIVYSLAKQYPNVRISVLSRPFARPFFQGLASNVCFMEADLKGEYKGLTGLNKLYRRLVAKQFTDIADLHNVLRTRFLRFRFLLGGYSVAHINKHKQGKKLLCREENKVFIQQPTSFRIMQMCLRN